MKKCIFHRHSRRGAVLREKIPICIHRLYSRWSLTIEQVWAKKRRLLGIPIFQMCSDPRMRARGPLWNNLSSLRLAHRRSAPWFQRPPPHVDNIFQAKLADHQLFLTEQLSATNCMPVLLPLMIKIDTWRITPTPCLSPLTPLVKMKNSPHLQVFSHTFVSERNIIFKFSRFIMRRISYKTPARTSVSILRKPRRRTALLVEL